MTEAEAARLRAISEAKMAAYDRMNAKEEAERRKQPQKKKRAA